MCHAQLLCFSYSQALNEDEETLSSLKMLQAELRGQEESRKLQNNTANQFVVCTLRLIGWNLCFHCSNYRPLFSNLLMTHCK